MSIALILPVYNAKRYVKPFVSALASQKLQPDEWLVVDSQSEDGCAELFVQAGARVVSIPRQSFNHGGTRRWASEQVDSDILIYMTQDAVFANSDSLLNLKKALDNDLKLGLAYGRQLPYPEASILSAHARQFNYPDTGLTKCLSDAPKLGIKTFFCSDVFCAYRKSALALAGGFPENVIGSEDAYVAAHMLLKGLNIRYEASAEVFHSHDYSLMEEFRRYFDIGVFYGREKWVDEHFGQADGEGWRFVLSEINQIKKGKQLWRLPEVLLRSAFKLTGYRLGHLECYLPTICKRKISMFSVYWNKTDAK